MSLKFTDYSRMRYLFLFIVSALLNGLKTFCNYNPLNGHTISIWVVVAYWFLMDIILNHHIIRQESEKLLTRIFLHGKFISISNIHFQSISNSFVYIGYSRYMKYVVINKFTVAPLCYALGQWSANHVSQATFVSLPSCYGSTTKYQYQRKFDNDRS